MEEELFALVALIKKLVMGFLINKPGVYLVIVMLTATVL